MTKRKQIVVHICGLPDGPYRYGGFLFEVHPYLGPCPVDLKGNPTNKRPPRGFWKMWETFEGLRQSERDNYAVQI